MDFIKQLFAIDSSSGSCNRSFLIVLTSLPLVSVLLISSTLYRYRAQHFKRYLRNPQNAPPNPRTPWEGYIGMTLCIPLLFRSLLLLQSLGTSVESFSPLQWDFDGGYMLFILLELAAADWWESRMFKKKILQPYYAAKDSLPTLEKALAEVPVQPDASEPTSRSLWRRVWRAIVEYCKPIWPEPTAENVRVRYHMQFGIKFLIGFIFLLQSVIFGCLARLEGMAESDTAGMSSFQLGWSAVGLYFFVRGMIKMWEARRFERAECSQTENGDLGDKI